MKKIILPLLAILILTACGESSTRKEIARRKAALEEKQQTELLKAQEELRRTDSLLLIVEKDLAAMTPEVEAHKKALKATPEELTALTRLRVHRDSIRTQYETLGLKIRYIRKKIKEVEKCKSEKKSLFAIRLSLKICTFAADMTQFEKTNAQFEQALAECRALFEKKLHDYKASWRILRPTALTDQLFIKAKRIRSLEIKKESLVGEGIRPEFVALINYGIVGLIQLSKGFADTVDITNDEAMALYDEHAREALQLMKRKNHDYDEAWRGMRVSSYTALILTKIERIKEIENLQGETLVSEGIDANYMDIINYAVFGVIKLTEENDDATA